VGKIFDALEKFGKEHGAAVSDRIKDSDYEALMQFDEATGRIHMDDPTITRDPRILKRLKTYRLINDNGTLTPAGRDKYEQMKRKHKPPKTQELAVSNQIKAQAPPETQSERHGGLSASDWTLLMRYDRATGNLLKYDPDTGLLDEGSKNILQDPATVQRLIDNQMILPGGWLTPEAKRECENLAERHEKEKAEASVKLEKPKAADKPDKTAEPRELMRQSDMEALMQYDPETLKLDLKNAVILNDPGIVKRLLENDMIDVEGKLSPKALVRCRVLTSWNQELEEKQAVLQKPKESISEKLQTIADKGKPQKQSDEVSEKKLKIIPLEKSKAGTKIEAKKEAKESVSQKPSEEAAEKEQGITPLEKDRIETKIETEKEEKETVHQQPSEEAAEKKQTITPPEKDRIETRIEAKKEKEKVPEKTDNFVTALESRTKVTKAAEAPPERKFTLGETPAGYDRNAIDKNLVALLNPQSFEAEQFKILRTNLLFPASGKSPQSIMVTSVAPGEGKSFVAANLAVSVATHVNWNVLLVDCDLRRPSVHSKFGFGEVPGLSDYLSIGRELPSLLLRTAVDHLTILPGGRPPSNPSELLSSERMAAFIDEVTARYNDRLIILDSPPPKLTAESTALARHVDGILLVVKYAKTPRNAAAELISKLGKDKVLGAIVNNFDAGSARYHKKYYGGDYYSS
jgi:exopolysaccharide/PEP-CTERM locus tyrosine autokinase